MVVKPLGISEVMVLSQVIGDFLLVVLVVLQNTSELR